MTQGIKYLILGILSLINTSAIAQDETETRLEIPKCVRVEAGFVHGRGFIEEPLSDEGFVFSYAYNVKLSTNLGIGLGSDLLIFPNETLLPLYLDINRNLGVGKDVFFISAKLGYSLAWNIYEYGDYDSYDYKGGLSLSPGIGYRMRLNEKFSLAIKASYNYQRAKMDYWPTAELQVTESLNYHFFLASLAVMLEQL